MNLRKEGRKSLVAQVLIGAFHMQTCENKKACSHMNLRAHTINEANPPDRIAFFGTRQTTSTGDECFTDSE